MSLATRCTHCQTVFRINGTQLAAAQGWVRCGGCSQVFDAASNLVTTSGQALDVPTVNTPDLATPESVAQPTPHEAPAFQAMPDIDLELPDLGALKVEEGSPNNASLPVAAQPTAATGTVGPDVETAAPLPEDTTTRQERTAAPEQAYTAHQDPAPLPDEPPEPKAPADIREPYWKEAPMPPTSTSSALPASGSDLQAQNGPGVTGWLAIAGLALTLFSLCAFAARGHIAQTWPEARPWMVHACSALGCQLPAIRLIDAVKLQGSSLSRDDTAGHHRLRIQLTNAETVPVLMPAFDFSLVDSQGEVLARRMIDPQEFQPALVELEPGAEASVLVTLDLRALDSTAISSFRLLAFYP